MEVIATFSMRPIAGVMDRNLEFEQENLLAARDNVVSQLALGDAKLDNVTEYKHERDNLSDYTFEGNSDLPVTTLLVEVILPVDETIVNDYKNHESEFVALATNKLLESGVFCTGQWQEGQIQYLSFMSHSND